MQPKRQIEVTPTSMGAQVRRWAVGFEFEAQWNVRRVIDPELAEGKRQEQSREREGLVTAKILQLLLTPGSPHRERNLTEAEKARPIDELRTYWLESDARPTLAGRERLSETPLAPDGAVRRMLELSWLGRGEITEEPLPGDNLGKGRVDGLVTRGAGFDLTADVGSGGSDLEWITDPLTSAEEVAVVMHRISAMAAYLDSQAHRPFIPSEELTQGGGVPVPSLRIYPSGGRLSFAPQATVGLRLDRLTDLIDFLNVSPDAPGLGSCFPFTGARRRQRLQARRDLGLGMLQEARVGAERAVTACHGTLPAEDRKGLTGLVMHLASYLLEGDRLAFGAGSKSVAGALMARTDFAHNFTLLSAPVQEHFRARPKEFADLVLNAAELSDRGEEPVLPRPVEHFTEEGRVLAGVSLTRAEWLSAIAGGDDLLKHWDNLSPEQRLRVDEPEAQAVHKSLAALGTVNDRVRATHGDVPVLVVELRRMRDDLPANDLAPLAQAVYGLIERLNTSRSPRYRRT